MSIAEYAKAVAGGATTFEKKTPLDNIAMLKDIADAMEKDISELKKLVDEKKDKALYNVVLDQELLGYLAGYYSYHLSAALNLRFFNDTSDESKRALARSDAEKSIEYFTSFANLWSSRFKVERLARHGVIDPLAMLETLKGDLKTIDKWIQKNY